MNKLLLVDFPYYDNNYHYSIGLLNLKTILEGAFYEKLEVIIIDFNTLIHDKVIDLEDFKSEYGNKRIYDYISSFNADYVGFSTIAFTYDITLNLAKNLRKSKPDTKIFLGGPQATVTCLETLQICDWIDFICLGEAESYIIELLDALIKDQDISDLRGIACRRKNEYVINKNKHYYDLEKLPYIDISFMKEKIKIIDIEIGRGCPYNCTYCSTSYFWERKYRVKSVDKLINEIKLYVEKINVRRFNFLHDLFTTNKLFVTDFCKKILESGLNIIWGCSSRPDTLDKDLIKIMKNAGCTDVFLGIETGSPEMQKIMNKNLNLDKSIDVIKKLDENGIEVRSSFIYGYPEETESQLKETLDLISFLRFDLNTHVTLNKFEFYSKTKVYEQYKSKMKHLCNQVEFNVMHNHISSFIIENPVLFSSFYNINNNKKYDELDVFVNYYINIISYFYPNSSRYIAKTYSLLNLYFDFKNIILKTKKLFDKTRIDSLQRQNKHYRVLMKEFEHFVKSKDDVILKLHYEFDEKFIETKLNAIKAKFE